MLLCWCDAKSSSQRIHFIQISPLWQSFALCSVRRRFRLNTFMASVRAAASIVCYLGEARANNQLTLLATERSPFSPSHYICSHVHSQPLDMTGLINRSSSVTAADLFEIQMHTISIRPTLKMWVLKTMSINLSELAAGIVVWFYEVWILFNIFNLYLSYAEVLKKNLSVFLKELLYSHANQQLWLMRTVFVFKWTLWICLTFKTDLLI